MTAPVIVAVSSLQLRSGFPLTLNFEVKAPGVYTYNIHFKLIEDDSNTAEAQPLQSQTQYDSPTEYERWVTEEALHHRSVWQNSKKDNKDDLHLQQVVSSPEATTFHGIAGQDGSPSTPGGLAESQTQYDSPTEYNRWVEQEASCCRLIYENEIQVREAKDQSQCKKQSVSVDDTALVPNGNAEHPIASFLSIFAPSSFVTPDRPSPLSVEPKLFDIGVELGEIVPDSQGESLEQVWSVQRRCTFATVTKAEDRQFR
ncbi:hypothetical protein EDD85DRAFT_783002 [Armillaria nabsnona]|nr:hypothetical protein EDD85DRAFT_783002 [Armillaria nabsnona]